MEGEGKIGFDRSRVRILLCDKDSATAQEVKELLCRCSYQVSVVKTARQVVEVLNITDSKVDLVLSEVELPNGRGFKMLKHIVKSENFKHIPIVMMSARDEMAVVVKCLKLGAADYLVKPLRINELLNLWTHMWRRRRMLGLTEKHILKGHLSSRNTIAEIFVSDTSESNTFSTDIFSEDSNDNKVKKLKPISEEEEQAPELELSLTPKSKDSTRTTEIGEPERRPSPPRKSELKLGQSSAFLSYTRVVSRTTNAEKPDSTTQPPTCMEVPVGTSQQPLDLEEPGQVGARGNQAAELTQTQEPDDDPEQSHHHHHQHSIPWSSSSTTGAAEQYQVLQINDPRAAAAAAAHAATGVFNQAHIIPPLMVPHSIHPSTLLQPPIHYYQAVPPPEATPIPAAAFSYYPFPLHIPSQQVPWNAAALPQVGLERKAGVAERREAALHKFRQKRKDRCYEKKIRYASRKRLAEQRPRVKGQFVRRAEEYEDEDEDDDETGRDMSPESGVEVTQ